MKANEDNDDEENVAFMTENNQHETLTETKQEFLTVHGDFLYAL